MKPLDTLQRENGLRSREMSMPFTRATQWSLLISAFMVLAAGVAVYLFARDPQQVHFLAGWWQAQPLHVAQIAAVGAWLPSFAHVYALSVVTAMLLKPSRRAVFKACLSWWVIDSLFEFGQHQALAPLIAAALPKWFTHVPLLDHAGRYFLYGTFDIHDLLAIAAGALAAALTVTVVLPKEGQPCVTTL